MTEQTDQATLKDCWVETLTNHGLEVQVAENIAVFLQADPRLQFDTQSRDEAEEIITEAIDSLNLGDFDGFDETERDRVIHRLQAQLQESLAPTDDAKIAQPRHARVSAADSGAVTDADDTAHERDGQAAETQEADTGIETPFDFQNLAAGTPLGAGVGLGGEDIPSQNQATQAAPGTAEDSEQEASDFSTVLAYHLVRDAKSNIQDDLDELEASDTGETSDVEALEPILVKLAGAAIAQYEHLMKAVILPGKEGAERDLLYKTLVEQQMQQIVAAEFEEEEKEENEQ